jgi:hypothetical protein
MKTTCETWVINVYIKGFYIYAQKLIVFMILDYIGVFTKQNKIPGFGIFTETEC